MWYLSPLPFLPLRFWCIIFLHALVLNFYLLNSSKSTNNPVSPILRILSLHPANSGDPFSLLPLKHLSWVMYTFYFPLSWFTFTFITSPATPTAQTYTYEFSPRPTWLPHTQPTLLTTPFTLKLLSRLPGLQSLVVSLLCHYNLSLPCQYPSLPVYFLLLHSRLPPPSPHDAAARGSIRPPHLIRLWHPKSWYLSLGEALTTLFRLWDPPPARLSLCRDVLHTTRALTVYNRLSAHGYPPNLAWAMISSPPCGHFLAPLYLGVLGLKCAERKEEGQLMQYYTTLIIRALQEVMISRRASFCSYCFSGLFLAFCSVFPFFAACSWT